MGSASALKLAILNEQAVNSWVDILGNKAIFNR
jgi:hypothetical protein